MTNLLAVHTGGALYKKCCLSKIHFCGPFIECDCYTLNLLANVKDPFMCELLVSTVG